MRQILAEFALLSYGQTQRYDKSLGEGERLGPPGESKPEGEYWSRKYMQAKSEEERSVVCEDAQRALQAIRVRTKPLPPTDPEKERLDRITSQSVGTRDIDVATAYGMSLARVHKMRRQRNQDPLDGKGANGGLGREDVIRLRKEGRTVRQISMVTNLSKSTVHRLLGEVS